MSETNGSLLHPRHWLTWLGLGCLWLISLLPWGAQKLLARGFGAFCFHLLPVRRHVVLVNLRLCFPAMSESARRVLGRRHYQALALGVLEVARCWWRKPEALPPHRIEGLDRLRAAVARGKGVLLVSGHFTTLEITGRMLSLQQTICCLYRDPNNAALAHLLRHHRSNWARKAIEMHDLKGLVRALREGEIVWYAPDQGKRTKQSELLPFFGEPCITNTSTPRLAEMTGAAVLTFYGQREADGSYTLMIDHVPAGIPSSDPAADTLQLVASLEAAIEKIPEQYLWVHRRFKSRKSLPDPYV